MYKQGLFIGFEGVLIAVACVCLNIFHPSVCFKEMMDGEGGLHSFIDKKVKVQGMKDGGTTADAEVSKEVSEAVLKASGESQAESA